VYRKKVVIQKDETVLEIQWQLCSRRSVIVCYKVAIESPIQSTLCELTYKISNPFTDACCPYITQLTNLKKLSLYSTFITNQGMRILSERFTSQLSELCLSYLTVRRFYIGDRLLLLKTVDDDTIRHLTNLQNLKKLHFTDIQCTNLEPMLKSLDPTLVRSVSLHARENPVSGKKLGSIYN
jgi:hypothetical protein